MPENNPLTFLIATVGGAPQPIVASIIKWKPTHVIFVVSDDSRDNVTEDRTINGKLSPCILTSLKTNGVSEFKGRWSFFGISDPQDYTALVREMRRLDNKVTEWRTSYGDPNPKIVVDFTGGTKAMSAAMALVASRWKNSLVSYVGGTEREKDGVGVVVSGKEQILHSQNPWEALGYLVEEQARVLFNSGDFASAKRLLEPARNAAPSPRKEELNVLIELNDFFDLWDKFQHTEAQTKFAKIEKNWNNLPSNNGIKIWFSRSNSLLEKLCGADTAENRHARAIDLLANAARRIKQGAYDDAVARLYRATEALAQARLLTHNFTDTANISFAALPVSLKQEWTNRPKNEAKCLKLALQDDYKLLSALDDELGKKFTELKLDDPQKSPLSARNHSILAHGYQPISKSAADALFADALKLAECEEENLLTFPKI
jgi:CRISPR-associated protein (TIGR02710 family)